jgi:3-deoxy-7-phosphoheptulonate synthase
MLDIQSPKQETSAAPKHMKFERRSSTDHSIVHVKGVPIGNGKPFVVIAGPCSVESEDQILKTARAVQNLGAKLLRGGAYKPRTSPYNFQGLGNIALDYLHLAKTCTGLGIVTEVMEISQIKRMHNCINMFQVGARNMQNYTLLSALGKINKPVLLKRGMVASIDELLLAAEYILSGGNNQVILCLRGLRSFDQSHSRNLADLADIPVLLEKTHLPVIFDPSHACGRRDLIIPLSRAALTLGAHGIIVEVHPDPDHALSDGAQSLDFEQFSELMKSISEIEKVMTTKP